MPNKPPKRKFSRTRRPGRPHGMMPPDLELMEKVEELSGKPWEDMSDEEIDSAVQRIAAESDAE